MRDDPIRPTMSDDEPVHLDEKAITPAEADMFRALVGATFSSDVRFELRSGQVIDGEEMNCWIRHFERKDSE